MPSAIDLTGRRFDRLTALKRAGLTRTGNVLWLCRCACGKTCKVASGNLASGHSRSCGCLRQRRDLAGQVFGRLTVLERAGKTKTNQHLWLCRCECGKTCKVTTISLTRTKGHTRSCGCLHLEKLRAASEAYRHDLAGMAFGRLTVVRRCRQRGSNGAVWLCHCVCGKTCKVRAGSLVSGGQQSCGCLKGNPNDLAGQTFGRLTVIGRSRRRGRARQILWLCRCACGKGRTVFGQNLVRGHTKSCGCLKRELSRERMVRRRRAALASATSRAGDNGRQGAEAGTTAPRKRGRKRGKTEGWLRREREMLEAWDRGEYPSKAQAGEAHGFHRSDATKIINAHERKKCRK